MASRALSVGIVAMFAASAMAACGGAKPSKDAPDAMPGGGGVDAVVAAIDANTNLPDAGPMIDARPTIDAGPMVDAMPNTDPTISDIANQTTAENTSTLAIPFTIGDAETAVASLAVTATSDNAALVANAGLLLGGTGASRTISVTPVADANTPTNGTATITVTVDDGSGGTVTDTFIVTVTAVNTPPATTDDEFLLGAGTTGNVRFDPGSFSVMDNDVDPDGPALSVSPVATTDAQGTFDIAADGTFTYNPAPGFTGEATYTYTLNDNDPSDPQTATGTVRIDVTLPMVWFVDNSAGAAGTGDGRDTSPFTTLRDVESAPVTGNGDTIRLRQGDGTTTNQSAGIQLSPGQTLEAAPTHNPVIENLAGNGIDLASDTTVRGIDVQGATGAGVAADSVTSSNIELTDVSITGASVGIGLQSVTGIVSLSGVTIDLATGTGFQADGVGTLSGTVPVVSVADGAAVDIRNSGSSLAFTVISNGSNGGIVLSTNTGITSLGTVSITSSGQPGLFANSAGTVNITGGTLMTTAASGVVGMDTAFNVALTGVMVNNASGAGIFLDSNTGIFGFGSLNVSNADGAGLLMNNSGTVNVSGPSSTIGTAGGPAVDITGTNTGMTFSSLSSTDSPRAGISLNGTSGTFTITGSSRITRPAGPGVDVVNSLSGGTTIDLGDTVVDERLGIGYRVDANGGVVIFGTVEAGNPNDVPGPAITVSNNMGRITFERMDLADSVGPGIRIENNTGSFELTGNGTLQSGGSIARSGGPGVEISFNGGSLTFAELDILTPSSDGFNANTPGDLSISGGTISDAGTRAGNDGIHIFNPIGTVDIVGTSVTNPFENGISIQGTDAFSGTHLLEDVFVSGNDPTGGRAGILIVPPPLGVTDTIVRRATVADTVGCGVEVDAVGPGTVGIEIVALDLQSVAPITAFSGGNVCIRGDSDAMGAGPSLTVVLDTPIVNGARGSGIHFDIRSGSIDATVDGAIVGTTGVPGSGSSNASALQADFGDSGPNRLTVRNSVFRGFAVEGLNIGNSGSPQTIIDVLDSTVDEPGPSASAGLFVGAFGPMASVCATISGNTVGMTTNIFVWQDNSEFGMPGYMGGPYDTTAVGSFLDFDNSAIVDTFTTGTGTGFSDATSYCF